MAVFKCKMCGGNLEVQEGMTVCECEYCGTQQTLPKLDDERKINLYDRANHFRRNNEYDKASNIYEQILNEDNSDAEAYWSLVLCKYGIEYVEDPSSHKRIPTVNRAQFTSIFDDDNYKSAIKYADSSQRVIYENEAKAINEIQKGILSISSKEDPFDVFICYKETDNNGRRTPDSVLANELYHQLTQEGFRVFFARITLEDKLGSAYEPYIFAALNSAKMMVVLGTKPEYFNAVWVKNEWSRFLALIKQGQKKILIPAYKDMDPYDLPEEFSHLQAQDMSKLGFMQDLIRGIKKIAEADTLKTTVVKETVISGGNTNTAPLLKRAFMFLEDEDWNSANEYCEKVLDIDPENPSAYLGKLLSELRVRKQESLKDCAEPFDHSKNYQKAVRFGDEKLKTALTGYIENINTRNENARLDGIYTRAKNAMSAANTERAYKEAARLFESIDEYQDSAVLAQSCYEKAEEKKKKAEEEKKKAEEEKKKCDELYKEYKAAVRNEKTGAVKKAEAHKEIDSLKIIYNNLKNLKDSWQGIEDELFSLNRKLKSIKSEMDSLTNEKSSLGFFAVKRKKEITERMVVLGSDQKSLMDNIASLEKKTQGYNTLSELESKISRTLQQIEEQSKIIEKLSSDRSSQSIRDELCTFELGKKLIKRFDCFQNIKEHQYITFGAYEQDNNTSNGKEDIEWLVLEVKDGKALVISKYALDCKPYNTSKTDVTWRTCTLRKWLNNDFINAAFSDEEKAMIPTVTVSADENPYRSTNPGNATQDQVFLLSITEAEKYFISDSERRCDPTNFAVANGAYKDKDKDGNCWWWLRSPGNRQHTAVFVSTNGGFVGGIGFPVNCDVQAVRPALWIDLYLYS